MEAEEITELAIFDPVERAIEKADPDELGKVMRLLEAAKLVAAGKGLVNRAARFEAWLWQTKRVAGEMLNNAPISPISERALKDKKTAVAKTAVIHRHLLRIQMGLSEREGRTLLIMAQVKRPIFNDYVERIEAREADATVTQLVKFEAHGGVMPSPPRMVKSSLPDKVQNGAVDLLKKVVRLSVDVEEFLKSGDRTRRVTILKVLNDTAKELKGLIDSLG